MLERKCSECGGIIIKTISDLVCWECGLILEPVFVDPLYQSIESNNSFGSHFVSQGSRKNVADGLGTFVGRYGTRRLFDSSGTLLNPEKHALYGRLKRIHDIYLHAKGKEREYNAFRILNKVIGLLEISESVKSDAAYIFRKIHQKLKNKLSLAELVAASIYLSVRHCNERLQLKDLVEVFQNIGYHISGKKTLRAAGYMRQYLRISIRVVVPGDYLEQIYEKLFNSPLVREEISRKITSEEAYRQDLRLATNILLNKLPQEERGGRNPYVLACATIVGGDILIARGIIGEGSYTQHRSRGLLNQRRVAKIADCAEYTLREHFLQIVKPHIKEVEKRIDV